MSRLGYNARFLPTWVRMETHTLLQKIFYLIKKEPWRWVGEKRNYWDALSTQKGGQLLSPICSRGAAAGEAAEPGGGGGRARC